MNILVISKSDFAGSGYRFAEALRACGHTAHAIALTHNPYGYALDLVPGRWSDPTVQKLIDAADVLHFKGDWPVFEYTINTSGKVVVQTCCGSGFRRANPALSLREPYEQEWHPLSAYADVHGFSVLTPDLMYPQLPAVWIPHVLPFNRVRWMSPGIKGPIIIGHSPSSRGVKGTDTVVLPAIAMLQDNGWPVRELLIEGVSNAECLEMKARCTLFFDQGILPAYGMSAVEAMAMGIPVITRLPEATRAKDVRLRRHCPVIGFEEATPQSAVKAIAHAINDRQWRDLSQRTVEYFHRVHGQFSVGKQLTNFYQAAMRRAAA